MTWTGKLTWFLLAVAVVGCGGLIVYVVHTSGTGRSTIEPPAQTVPAFDPKTEAYYLAHQGEMKQRLAECKNHGIGIGADTPEARDCTAAAAALNDRFFGASK
ncbi:hypothetical protein EVC45_31105 [Paraburkholderia sp. UYCP14C]|uniref:hypothetical protein n=1 Tax=Paraburkholderia sp. UYCP14C TaxID=2511130 RepID=UPI00101ECBA9|nr:hypothetical protein [Paraburkholderia sp. UYCP14C]RZF25863.1 hypothetical protein EVC45_31105 [Paraburkholderia sp. UYCP14C]